uniref:Uncharacterized protein n=1 Tax=Oryza punctata TaxID=4537 RepID=A0A0E0MHN7_ORYPU
MPAAAATLLPADQLNSLARPRESCDLNSSTHMQQQLPENLKDLLIFSKVFSTQSAKGNLAMNEEEHSHQPHKAGSKTHVRQSVLYSERKRQPRRERGGTQPPTLLTASEHDSTTVESSRLKEASPSLSDELRELEEYRKTHTFSSFEDAIRYVLSVHPPAFLGFQ